MKTFLSAGVCLLLVVHAASAAARPEFPKHWGDPPRIETRDYRPLPGGYGFGSSTMAKWIQQNLDRDAAAKGTGREPEGKRLGPGVLMRGDAKVSKAITLVLEGTGETESEVIVRFLHKSGEPKTTVKAERGKDGGPWQATFTPDRSGEWIYRVKAASKEGSEPSPLNGRSGSFTVSEP